ncbi:MAG: coenzyme F420-0:L-glutamate ligase [Betaproteobacteria bacterium RIFCSPLOWO2_12_FULL_66_14]|nr:MAG: coenzyme F420-0:L-glutamate ligase [Betaproteobacteria bacterium RIFCSPLOWO2_12_FULL_66_14]
MEPAAARLELLALSGVPLVRPGDDLAPIVLQALRLSGRSLEPGDVLVVAQKIVSKSEDRYVELAAVEPSPKAMELAEVTGKDPALLEVILRESRDVVRVRNDVLIVEHRLGFVLANAGVDASNVGEQGRVLLLPADPDASCRALREKLRGATGTDVGVVINDSWGRAWRLGTIGTALGVSGLPALVDLRGVPDLFGRALRSTEVAVADELAAAASLIMGQAGEGHPLVLARGFPYPGREGRGAHLLRPKSLDLFR